MLTFHNGFKYRNSASEVITGTIFATFCAILVKIGPQTPKISQGVSVSALCDISVRSAVYKSLTYCGSGRMVIRISHT